MKHPNPTFCARFADGEVTRMTVWHDAGRADTDLDLVRGVKLARYAYRSRTGKEPVQIIEAHFEREGETLQEYDYSVIKPSSGVSS